MLLFRAIPGVVAVANSAGNTLSLTGELNSGDTIIVGTGSTALLHIWDGSELSLGSTTSETKLELSTLVYNDDNNLASKVSLLLSLGEVWVEAPHLRTETNSASDFSIGPISGSCSGSWNCIWDVTRYVK